MSQNHNAPEVEETNAPTTKVLEISQNDRPAEAKPKTDKDNYKKKPFQDDKQKGGDKLIPSSRADNLQSSYQPTPPPPPKLHPKVHSYGRKKLKPAPTIVDLTKLYEPNPPPTFNTTNNEVENVIEIAQDEMEIVELAKKEDEVDKIPQQPLIGQPKARRMSKKLEKFLRNDSKPMLFTFMRQKDVPDSDTPNSRDEVGGPSGGTKSKELTWAEKATTTVEELWPKNQNGSEMINPNDSGDTETIEELKSKISQAHKEWLKRSDSHHHKSARGRALWKLKNKEFETLLQNVGKEKDNTSGVDPYADTFRDISTEDLKELSSIMGKYEVLNPERFFWVDDSHYDPFYNRHTEPGHLSNSKGFVDPSDSQRDLQDAFYRNDYIHPMQAPIVPLTIRTGFEKDYPNLLELDYPEVHSKGDGSKEDREWRWYDNNATGTKNSLASSMWHDGHNEYDTSNTTHFYRKGSSVESRKVILDQPRSNSTCKTRDEDGRTVFKSRVRKIRRDYKKRKSISQKIDEGVEGCVSSLCRCLAYSIGWYRAEATSICDDPWNNKLIPKGAEESEEFLAYDPDDFEILGNPEVFMTSFKHPQVQILYENVVQDKGHYLNKVPWFYYRKPPGPDYSFSLTETEDLINLSKKLIVSGDYENEIPLFLQERVLNRNRGINSGRFFKIFAYRGINLLYCIETKRLYRDLSSISFNAMRCRASIGFEIIHPESQKVILKIRPSFLGEVCALTRYINDCCLGCFRLTKWEIEDGEGEKLGRIICLPRSYNWTNCAGGPYLILENAKGLRFSWFEQIFPIFDCLCTSMGSRRISKNPNEIIFEDGLEEFEYGRVGLCKPYAVAHRPAIFTMEFNKGTEYEDRLLILGGSFVLASMAWFTPNPTFADRFFFKIGNLF